MKNLFFFALLLAFVGCVNQNKTRTEVIPECTFDTPLREGIPGSPGHLIASERNSNGQSELANLMRKMVSDLEAARSALETQKSIPILLPTHRKMRCAWPTDVHDRNAAYETFAVAYLEQVKAFDASPKDKKLAFNNVLGACAACHENTCPGPLAVIEKLKF